MPRWVRVPVRITRDREGRAMRLTMGRRSYAVDACLERWRECGEWWNGEGERAVERLLLVGGAVVEISGPLGSPTRRDAKGEAWSLDTWFD